jgi:hypothetical protein
MDEAALLRACMPDVEAGADGHSEAPHSGLLMHLLRNLMPGQDLTRVLIPSFFLEPRSLVEKFSDMLMHPELILGCVCTCVRSPPPLARSLSLSSLALAPTAAPCAPVCAA